jgi:nitrous oxidase accessory protein NosD
VVTKTVTLSGAGRQSTIIDGEGGAPLTFQNASGGGVTGLTLKGAGKGSTDAGLVVRKAAGVVIRDVEIRENGRAGIYVESSQRIVIAGAAISGTEGEEGVQFRGCHDCAIENSVISYRSAPHLRQAREPAAWESWYSPGPRTRGPTENTRARCSRNA